MKLLKTMIAVSMMLHVSGAQATSDSDSVELVIGKGSNFYVGEFPPEVRMNIDPFSSKHGRKDVFIPIRWNVSSDIKLTGKLTCDQADKVLCKKLWVASSYPHELQQHISALRIDKTEVAQVYTFTDSHSKKVDNPKWKWSFGAWGSFHTPMEARMHRATLTIKVEVGV